MLAHDLSSAGAGKPTPRRRPRDVHSFQLGVQHEGATLLLRLCGAFDWSCVCRVEAELQRVPAASIRRVVFDLQDLSFLDIAGLRTLLRADERARSGSFEVIVVRPTGLVNRIFTLTSAGEELTIVDSWPRPVTS